ncbi:MAG: metallophosphoesterase [Candidatus Eisenbacteria bacterium]
MMRTLVASVIAVCVLACLCSAAAGTGSEYLFRFAILSDRTGGHTPGIYPQVIEEINLLNPDFVVTVGDHIEGYGEDYERSDAEWDSVQALIGALEVPVYMTPGNHDIWDDEAEAMYRARTGFDPFYSFDHGNTHFIVLDNSRIDVAADFPDDQKDWLVADLSGHSDAENIFVFAHKPLWAQTLVMGEPDALHEIFREHGVDAVFNGHLHHYFSTEFDGIDYTVIGSSGGGLYRSTEQPVTRGEFFQFGWVTVTSPGYELAIVDLGSVYPRSVVTESDVREIERVESEFVTMGAVRVFDDASLRAPVEVTIENVTDRVIEDVVVWDVPEGWTVEPEQAIVAVAPGDTETLTFVMLNQGDLYPAPRMSCRYPLSNGKLLDVDLPARVMRTAKGPITSDPPIIDGDPSDACWGSCAPVSRLHAGYDVPVEGRTEFSFACDTENLYLSAICFDPEMVNIAAGIEERDGSVFGEDCVGYFFQPDPDEMTVYQIYINPLGTVFDQRITFDETMWYTADREWDGAYDVATQRTDDRWSVEVRIPLDQIGGDIEAFPAWRANFRRKQARTGATGDWQVPIDYDPGTFGELVFE